MDRVRATGMAVACLFALLAPAAHASSSQSSILQDDDELIFSSPSHVAKALGQIGSLGVDQIRVSVIWAAVAPDPASFTKPSFDATNPAAYPPGAWDRYDTLVRDAARGGIGVIFDVTSPAPYWAAQGRAPAGTNYQKSFDPAPALFAQFVAAVGRRYDGHYVAGAAPPPPPPPSFLGLPLPLSRLLGNPPLAANPDPLPAVRSWSIWNEPNEAGWLTPQWRRSGRTWIASSPAMYRSIVDGAYGALRSTGHGGDQITFGETASRGSTRNCVGCAMRPMRFLRSLYCVGGSYRPLTGVRARLIGCPSRGDVAARFVAAHPVLFQASGYAHHPYAFTLAPNVSDPDVQDVPLINLSRLERGLDRIFAAYRRPPGFPVYLTEYGYKSKPPNPYARFTQAQQATFINEGEFMAWLDPRVRSSAQFLLVDDAPKAGVAANTPLYWSTFQTGLITQQGVLKPAFTAYRVPIWLADSRHGANVAIWGQLRPAARGSTQTALIQFRPAPSGTFTTIAAVQTANREGFVHAHVRFPAPGLARIAWTDPATHAVDHSRAAPVR